MESLVKSSDFAVIDSQTESFGSVDDIEDHLPSHLLEEDDLMSEGTTVMLFNIFTPEEVSFLSSLVGEDVVEELKENNVLLETQEESKKHGFESTEEEEGSSTDYPKDNIFEQRENTMKNMLNRLSDKYKKRLDDNSFHKESISSSDSNSEEKEKIKKMKVMIENLRAKLENSGKNDLNESSSYSAQRRTFENILGSKLRNLNSGIHRVDLEDILESELKLSNNKRLEDPIPPPHASKRQAPRLHPKLTHKRPQTSIVHRPSMNLKKQIKPIQDKVNPRAVAYRSLPLIDRYQTSPWPRTMSKSNVRSLPLYQHTPGPKVHTVGFDENPITKELPLQKPAPLISSDPFPDTKETSPLSLSIGEAICKARSSTCSSCATICSSDENQSTIFSFSNASYASTYNQNSNNFILPYNALKF
ncbi:unnamed protein product [Lepeophtheirus salmonis]|uniref:(salmon louse) hypothetical protein n=1 Tax=Lepeophtheirus salmonis TaxID=72036 RepID=A0A7R8CE01_LEPSM|nr:unnamed protein product [Lepeophtheirus salmonis]CAF2791046.1 unnamed protein product [Lepeophtheirus salmonis]